jgi:phage gp36-like protein
MSYATESDMVSRFGRDQLVQLTDEDGRGVIDSDKVTKALNDAAGEIDAHLEPRYQLPLATVPISLVRIACDLARYYLYTDAAPEQVNKRYDAAIKFLGAIARGDIKLGADDQLDDSENLVEFAGGGNVFDRSDDGFI